ncbi:MAG: AAA family ATPase [Bacteroidetes bacterium]|nr:AAA family ATPase [Bacteroidota bacterium]
MESIIEQSANLIENTTMGFQRYLHGQIGWKNRLIGIKGARGTGKTTMLLQYLKSLNLPETKAAYFSLDDLYFTQNSLKETAIAFYKAGGEILVLDEVHKYPTWAQEIKNLYDFYPKLHIIFTGSSIIDISKQQGDLSRRALVYELPGLSFREFLLIKEIADLPAIKLEAFLEAPEKIKKLLPKDFRPLEHLKEYLQYGYYPFILEGRETVHQKINQLIRTIVEYDMAELKDFDIRNARKLLQLVYVIAQQVPFKPNLSALAEKTNIHRNSLNNYLHFLEQGRILSLLYPKGQSVAVLQKPEKIFLNNTNLQFALAEENINIGTVRETYFLSQLYPMHKLNMPPQGDFLVNNKYTFEIGGKNKDGKQIKGLENSWIVRDDMEYPVGKALPLWAFGLGY